MKQKKLVETQKLTYDKIDDILKKFAEFCKSWILKIQECLFENSNQFLAIWETNKSECQIRLLTIIATILILILDFNSFPVLLYLIPGYQETIYQNLLSSVIRIQNFTTLHSKNEVNENNTGVTHFQSLLKEKTCLEGLIDEFNNKNDDLVQERYIQISNYQILIREAFIHNNRAQMHLKTSDAVIFLHDMKNTKHSKTSSETQQICCSVLWDWIGTLEKVAKIGAYSMAFDFPGFGFSKFTGTAEKESQIDENDLNFDLQFEYFQNFLDQYFSPTVSKFRSLQRVHIIVPMTSFKIIHSVRKWQSNFWRDFSFNCCLSKDLYIILKIARMDNYFHTH